MTTRKRIVAAVFAVLAVFGTAAVTAGPASASDSGWNGT
jgi:hypothetical protein